MAYFINTIDALGDDAVIDGIIQKTIPEYKDDTITKTGMYAFYKCTALETVELLNADYLANFSFYGCTALKTVNIPKTTTLGDSVFQSCETLESVIAPALVTLNSSVFRDCKALKSVKFPALEAINGSSVFASCKALERVDFPRLKSMYGGTVLHNCTALTALILRNTAAMATLTGAMTLSSTTYIYVPSALIDQYKAATNWSALANQFRKLEEWTVDGTVTGELATNRHMVRFFNSDGTLLGYKIVTTGSNATWDGDTPVDPSGNGYPFDGWTPAPTDVRADMDCYPVFESPAEIAEIADDWDTILASVTDGTYSSKYKIGNYKPLDIGTEGVINMQIAAFDTDDLADGSGKAPITWIAKELLATSHRMNPDVKGSFGNYTNGTGGVGGWEKCEMRTYLKNAIKPLIPETVRNAIKEVTKTQEAYTTNGGSYNQITTDDVWIPSYEELVGSDSTYYGLYNDNNDNRIKHKVSDTSATIWFLRTTNSSTHFYGVAASGGCFAYYAKNENAIALCFCT